MAFTTNSRAEAIGHWRREGGYLLYIGTGTYGVVSADELAGLRDAEEIAALERTNRNEIGVAEGEGELAAAG